MNGADSILQTLFLSATRMWSRSNAGYRSRLPFSSATGLYTWQYLHRLGSDNEALWSAYLARAGRRSIGYRALTFI
jgi:DUF971 family protein